MAETQRAISINIVQSDPREVMFAEYLRSTGGIKSHLLNAGYAHWYSIALAENGSSISTDVELALIDSLAKLSAQMTYLIEYHRIKHNIRLSPETLQRCGVGNQNTSQPIAANYISKPQNSANNWSELVLDSATDAAGSIAVVDDDDNFFDNN